MKKSTFWLPLLSVNVPSYCMCLIRVDLDHHLKDNGEYKCRMIFFFKSQVQDDEKEQWPD